MADDESSISTETFPPSEVTCRPGPKSAKYKPGPASKKKALLIADDGDNQINPAVPEFKEHVNDDTHFDENYASSQANDDSSPEEKPPAERPGKVPKITARKSTSGYKPGPKSKRKHHREDDDNDIVLTGKLHFSLRITNHCGLERTSDTDHEDDEMKLKKRKLELINSCTDTAKKAFEMLQKARKKMAKTRTADCENCDRTFSQETESKLCSTCRFWEHNYHLPENLCVPNGGKDCFICRQLKNKTPKMVRFESVVTCC